MKGGHDPSPLAGLSFCGSIKVPFTAGLMESFPFVRWCTIPSHSNRSISFTVLLYVKSKEPSANINLTSHIVHRCIIENA